MLTWIHTYSLLSLLTFLSGCLSFSFTRCLSLCLTFSLFPFVFCLPVFSFLFLSPSSSSFFVLLPPSSSFVLPLLLLILFRQEVGPEWTLEATTFSPWACKVRRSKIYVHKPFTLITIYILFPSLTVSLCLRLCLCLSALIVLLSFCLHCLCSLSRLCLKPI